MKSRVVDNDIDAPPAAVSKRDGAPIARDIAQCLESHEQEGMLRFITCGSIDDGKSTLIGCLLYESAHTITKA
jgi:bifunctional enzyme CysN/CysC